jgi:SAM-dependent methyltransferase
MVFVYTATLFVSATLLFVIQPLFARMALPLLGGSPAVWNSSVVFFQVILLAGYGYAHASARWLGVRRQAILHVALLLLPLLALPFGIPAGWQPPTSGSPIPSLLALLATAIGLPFFVVSISSPMLQSWFAHTRHRAAADPYFLYAASNAGSMLALLGYPALIEPWVGLQTQALLWAAGYLLLIALTLGCALVLWHSPNVEQNRNVATKAPRNHSSERLAETDPNHQDTKAPRIKKEAASRDTEPRSSRSWWLGALVVTSQTVSEIAGRAERKNRLGVLASSWLSANNPGRLTVRRRARWVLLAAIPSSLMLSVTTYVTTSIAPIPLLWVIPLALYLLTFILVFAGKPILHHGLLVRAFPIVLLPLIIVILAEATQPIAMLIVLHLLVFFVAAMVGHGELARDRPAASHLTEFYLLMSVGGALGGMFNALVAPVLFTSVAEYPLVLVLACLVLPASTQDERRLGAAAVPAVAGTRAIGWHDLVLPAALGGLVVAMILGVRAAGLPAGPLSLGLVFGAPCLLLFSFSRRPLRFALGLAALLLASSLYTSDQGRVLLAERSFFGISRVLAEPSGRYLALAHGSTRHGLQSLDPARRREPLTYYYPSGPIGQLFGAYRGDWARARVAVIGLGTGALTCYRQPEQQWTYYEIDPSVVHIARDSGYFSYLRECAPELEIVLGDARLSLTSAPDRQYDLIVLDAYSSDSIPIHLITQEALELYLRKLAPGGILALHISNQYLDLKPLVAALAGHANLTALAQDDLVLSPAEEASGKSASQWAVLARSPGDLRRLRGDARWRALDAPPDAVHWTDDYSSVLSVFRW